MGNHPPSQKLVVARVQVVFAQPIIVSKTMNEFGVLENDRPVRGGTTGQATDAAVDMGRGRDFDVPNGQTESCEDFPNGEFLSDGLNPLRCTDATHFLVFETGENVGKEGRRPDGVIVGKNDNVRRNFLDSLDHL